MATAGRAARDGDLLAMSLATGAAEDEAQVTVVIDTREGGRPAAGSDPARTPAQHAALQVIKAGGDVALVVGRPLLDLHVHQPVGGQFKRAHVQVAADELEREPVAGDEEPGLLRAGDGLPD